jgi:predicted ester cyclase
MKKLSLTIVGIIFCVLASLAQGNSQAERNHANTLQVYRAIETGDVSKLDQFIDKNIVDHSGPHGDMVGLDSAKIMFTEMHDHISNLKMEPIAYATGGDYHFDLVRMTGTTNSEYMGMPANTPIDMTSVNVVKIKNGKAVEHWRYSDAHQMMQMMQMMHGEHPMQGEKMMNEDDHKMMNNTDSTKQNP